MGSCIRHPEGPDLSGPRRTIRPGPIDDTVKAMLRTFRLAVIVGCCVAAMLAACTSSAPPGAKSPTAGQNTASSSLPRGSVIASYPGGNTVETEIRERRPRADGYYHIDTPATIAELRMLHVNTYLFLIWHSPTDWQDLKQEFLRAAQRAGIDVWAYIVPPSECNETGWCSRPFETDYVAWARHIAQLSTRYSNLTAWAIDDFTIGDNAKTFTPEYMSQMNRAVDAINPRLGLYTTAYYVTATSQAFYTTYAPYLRGIIFPYLDDPYPNTQVTSRLRPELDAVTSLADRHHMGVLLMIYAGRFSALDPPTPTYVATALRIGFDYARRGRIDGIVSYGTPHPHTPAVTSDVIAMYGRGCLVLQDSGGTTPTGKYASASQTVRVDPHAPRYTVSFWRLSRFYANPTPGRLLQVLVDDHVIWSSDLATDASGGSHEYRWMEAEGPIQVDPHYLRGKTKATLTFRLYEAQSAADYRSLTAFDTLQATGLKVADPGFERREAWRTRSTFGNLLPTVNVFDPNLSTHIFQAVARAFGR